MDLETAQKKQRKNILSLVSFNSSLQIIVPPAWMERYQGRHDVLLLDWSTLSFFQPNFVGGLPKKEDALPKSNLTGNTKKVLGKSLGAVSKSWPGFLDTHRNYKDACLNSLDVGNYVGRCLAGMARNVT